MRARNAGSGADTVAPTQNLVVGFLWMTAAAVMFSAMVGLVRQATETLPALDVVFWRNLFGFAFMVPWLLRHLDQVRASRRKWLLLWRSLSGLAAMLAWFTAITLLPLGEVVALSFTAPLFATAGAALILGETVRIRRWSATLVGFIGVLVILRPGTTPISLGVVLVLVSAFFIAASVLMIKSLARTESSGAIVAVTSLVLTVFSLVPALFVWQWPDWKMLGLLLIVGGVGTMGHLCFTRAMAAADASAVIPLDYLRLPMTALIGFVAFGEVLDRWTWAGAAIIIGATVYITRREAVVNRRLGRVVPPSASSIRDKL